MTLYSCGRTNIGVIVAYVRGTVLHKLTCIASLPMAGTVTNDNKRMVMQSCDEGRHKTYDV